MTMNSINAFLDRIIDYAGLFPPAKLGMQPVVENYARYRHHNHTWMLGRLICPASRMDEFAEHCDAMVPTDGKPNSPWSVSALGQGANEPKSFLSSLDDDLVAIRNLVARFGGHVVVDTYECKLPPALIEESETEQVRSLAADATKRLGELPNEMMPFFEIPFVGDWRRTVPAAIAALAGHNRAKFASAGEATAKCHPCGVKIRTGGVEAHQFPSPEQVACLIHACCENRIAFKATAGLHHPIRHHNDTVNTRMHGFLNVFGAAILAYVHRLDETTLVRILEDEAADNFRFDEEGFAWTSVRVSTTQIVEARRNLATSYGSCSFGEPIEDLERLALL